MTRQQRFHKEMLKGLKELGVTEDNPSIYRFTLETKYGKLYISLHEEDRKSKVHSCYTRFEDVDEAKKHLNCNPFSGKWNFHEYVKGYVPEEVAQSFVRSIGLIVNNKGGTDGTDKKTERR